MPPVREERTTTIADDMMHIDLSKLDSAYGKGSTSKSMLEVMQSQLAFQQMRTMMNDLKSDEYRRKIDDAKIQAQAYGLPQQAPGAPAANPADTMTRLFSNPDFMAKFEAMSPESQDRLMNSIMQASMMQGQGGGANNMLPFLMLMQQNQQKAPPKEEITAKDLVNSLTEGMKLAQGNQSNQPTDPVAMFNAMSTLLKPYQDQSSALQERLIETKLDALKDASQPMTFDKTVEMIKQTNEMFGGHQAASDTDVALAEITARARLQEVQLNLDARKMAEETKTENIKWQQIGGLLNTFAGIAGPGVINAVTQGVQGLGQQHQPQQQQVQQQQPQQRQEPPPQTLAPNQRVATLRCENCQETFTITSKPDGTWSPQARCPNCKDILDVDMSGFQ